MRLITTRKATRRNKKRQGGGFVSPADIPTPGKQKQSLSRLIASLNRLVRLISKQNYPESHRLSVFKEELLTMILELRGWESGTTEDSEIYRLVNLSVSSTFRGEFVDWYRLHSRNAVMPRDYERYDKLFDEISTRMKDVRKWFR